MSLQFFNGSGVAALAILGRVAGFGVVVAVGGVGDAACAGIGPFLWVNDEAGGLGIVNTQSGAVDLIGNTGVVFTDIAFDGAGNLWGITFDMLYSIDRTTAAATFVGHTGTFGHNAMVFSSDGTCYVAGGTGMLHTLDTRTGQSTTRGQIGFNSAGDLAFHEGSLYLSDTAGRLIRVALDPVVSGVVVGSMGFGGVFGLATGDDGVLYGVAHTLVFAVDTGTGQGTLVSNYGGHGLLPVHGTSFVNEVPGPASGLVAALGGVAALRRRRRGVTGSGR